MLGILDEIHQAEIAKNLGYQFVFLAEKIKDGYQIFFNLVKCTWKKTGIARNIILNLFSKLRPYVNANKKKSKHRISTLQTIDKHWGRAYYKWFFQIDEIICSDKFFYHFGIVMW